jgi:Fe-S cluster biogenesis protein NfuA
LQLTLKGGVESMLLHYCPEVKSVEEVANSEIEEVSKIQTFSVIAIFHATSGE